MKVTRGNQYIRRLLRGGADDGRDNDGPDTDMSDGHEGGGSGGSSSR